MRWSFPFCLHVEIIPANMRARQVREYYIRFFIYKESLALRDNIVIASQCRPLSIPSKLLILHGEVKSYCFTVSCVTKGMSFHL